ncbi:hypothetical protein AE42_02279 [Enterobacter kobei]|nr:hypothetical protein AE42_02279 [Enterobacter kobei]
MQILKRRSGAIYLTEMGAFIARRIIYLQSVPGAFVSIGSNSPFGLHHPAFNPDEALIEPAARYFAQLAEHALQHV